MVVLGGHDSTGGFEPYAQRCDVEQQQVLDRFALVTLQDGRLDSSTVGYGLIGVDRLVQLLAVEKVLEELLDRRAQSRRFGPCHIWRHGEPFDWLQCTAKQVSAKLFEAGTGNAGVEINALEQSLQSVRLVL